MTSYSSPEQCTSFAYLWSAYLNLWFLKLMAVAVGAYDRARTIADIAFVDESLMIGATKVLYKCVSLGELQRQPNNRASRALFEYTQHGGVGIP